MNQKEGANPVLDKSYDFALTIIDLYRQLHQRNEYIISKQLLRSGTSIGANVEEAQAGQSTRDFLAKMYVAYKEARETRYWLRLLERSQLCPLGYEPYLSDVEELLRLLSSITKSTEAKLRQI